MSVLAVYVPGDSVLHRLPAGVKLATLLLSCIGILLLREPWQIAVALVVVAGLYALARLPLPTMLAQARPLVLFAGVLLAFQWVVAGWEKAVVVVGGIVVVVLLAGLVSLTTRTTEIVEVVVAMARPLARFGVEPEHIGLLVALGIRSVAVVVDLSRDVRQAQVARGASASPMAFVTPLVIRTLRHADRLGDALVARGMDD